MRCITLALASSATCFISLPALAGSYSSGLFNDNVGAPDAALPGFVGTAGDGKTAAPNGVNPLFTGWASAVTSYIPAADVAAAWKIAANALGAVTGNSDGIVSLGDLTSDQLAAGAQPGQITLEFSHGIADRAGSDFAVFENAFGTQRTVFAELARVAVSSDGVHFATFPSASLTPAAVGPYGMIDPTDVHNLAGKHVNAYGNSWGTPFDLAELQSDPLVAGGSVNLHGIRFIKLIDVPGDGSSLDSSARPIYDAWLTTGSGGFDLDAIGTIHSWQAGDANLDGKVDVADLGLLATHWQQAGSWTDADFTGDGRIDVSDLGVLATNWQANVPLTFNASAVPEPASASLLALGALPMRRRRRFSIAAMFTALLLSPLARATTVDFEDLAVPAQGYYNGSDGAGGFNSRATFFQNTFSTFPGGFTAWSGFSYSNVNDPVTPGFGNQYAAVTGTGVGGAGTYGVGFDPGSPPLLTLPYVAAVQGMYLTNTTYAYDAVKDGDDGFGGVRQFGDDPAVAGSGNQGYPDYFRVTITGLDAANAPTGSLDFYLADYRFANNSDDYAVNDWRFVDLTLLGNVKSLSFSLDSSDVGTYGINTPTYFAMDNLTFVPEPGTLLALASIFILRRRR